VLAGMVEQYPTTTRMLTERLEDRPCLPQSLGAPSCLALGERRPVGPGRNFHHALQALRVQMVIMEEPLPGWACGNRAGRALDQAQPEPFCEGCAPTPRRITSVNDSTPHKAGV
jgi:hypothetical protein